MLLHSSPFLLVDGITVFRDHLDPEAFYYLLPMPELARDGDEPAFWATVILLPTRTDVAVGQQQVGRVQISFDVRLALSDAQRSLLEREIAKRYGREPKRLSPVPLSGGNVSLAIATPKAGQDHPELSVYEGHPPALTADNRAALTIAAQGAEAQILVAALSAGDLSAALVYELDVPGLAPSFQASMNVHWEQVYARLRERGAENFVFVSDEVERVIESLRQSDAIDLRLQELDEEGASAATRALFDELKSQVMDKLFTSPLPAGEVPVEDRIGHGVRDILSSLLPGTSHILRTLDQTALKTTSIDLSEQRVRTYKFYPQSTLSGLLARASASARLRYVRTEELPHRIEEVVVELSANAAALGVRGVELRVQVRAMDDSILLDESVGLAAGANERKSVRYRRPGAEAVRVRTKAELLLEPAFAPDAMERVAFDWREVEGGRIWFDPEEWLDTIKLQLELDDPATLDTAAVSMIIEAFLEGRASPLRQIQLAFAADTRSHSVSLIVPQQQRVSFRAREIFRRRGEPDFVRDVGDLASGHHRIMNPFGQSWTMEVRGVSTWVETTALVCEFRVWDVLRESWLHDEHSLSKESPNYTLRFSTSLETPRTAEARVTRLGADGSIVRGPWRDLSGLVVALLDDVRAERRLRATARVPKFAALSVQKLYVEIDLGAGVMPTLELRSDGARADFTYEFTDPTRPFYRYRVRARSRDGQRYTGPWLETGSDDLTITLPDAPWPN
ncbi:MAG: hypothetical protein ABW352_22810 [Polyangiales bacterium]